MGIWLEELSDAWKPLLALDEDFAQGLFNGGDGFCLGLIKEGLSALESGRWECCRHRGEEALEVAWEQLHSGTSWRGVSPATRMAYAKAQLLLSACEAEEGNMLECLRRLDMMLLMGPGGLHGPVNSLVDRVERLIERQAKQAEEEEQQPDMVSVPAQEGPAESPTAVLQPKGVKRPRTGEADSIARISPPSLLGFMEQHVRPRRPVILTGCMDDWPAMRDRAWADLSYLKRVAGRRTVPVEVGSGTYLSNEWGQKLMRVGDFIDKFIISEEEADGDGQRERGYLAQHELFEQIPQLRRDLLTPDYCALDDEDEEEEEEEQPVAVNAWFGPGGTVSPTHTDPYHNLLAQVVGSKEVWLFDPSQSRCMYPCAGMMNNNSQVNPKTPDLDRFPLFAKARPLRCVLRAGEMLYIPPYFWHHIESLETSFSVSFWWGKRKDPPPEVTAATPPSEQPAEQQPAK